MDTSLSYLTNIWVPRNKLSTLFSSTIINLIFIYFAYAKELSKVFIDHETSEKFKKKLKIQEDPENNDEKMYEKVGISSQKNEL